MTDTEPTFRYVADPWEYVSHRAGPTACNLCGRVRPVYTGMDWGENPELNDPTVFVVCAECLAAGRLWEAGLRMNAADSDALRAQIQERQPGLPYHIEYQQVHDRTRQIECSTPCPDTHQPVDWPAHCGDYLRFERPVADGDELARLAPDGDGRGFLAEHLLEPEDEDWIAEAWEDLTGTEKFLRFYWWRCLVCGEDFLTWDHD